MSRKDTMTGFGVGLFMGAVIGLAAGLLMAPRPGREIREGLKGKAGNIAEGARELTTNRKKLYRQIWEKNKE